MTITKLNSSAGGRGIQALVIVDPGPLAELLGDTEGPAHEDWDTSEERPDRNWKTWKGRVKFVRKIVDHVVEFLTPATTEPDFDLLSDFFSIEQVEGPQRKRQSGGEKKDRPVIDMPDFVPKWYQIKERAGGFTVARNAQVEMPEGAALRVAVAYDLPRGDPLRNWNALDFEIGGAEGKLTPVGKGMRPKRLAGNRLELRDLAPDFTLAVDGFDRHRDLFIRVEEIDAVDTGDDAAEAVATEADPVPASSATRAATLSQLFQRLKAARQQAPIPGKPGEEQND
jgi:hypothetical protein